MSILQKISLGYFVALMIAASLNYIPGLTDDQGLAFGIFALDLSSTIRAACGICPLGLVRRAYQPPCRADLPGDLRRALHR